MYPSHARYLVLVRVFHGGKRHQAGVAVRQCSSDDSRVVASGVSRPLFIYIVFLPCRLL